MRRSDMIRGVWQAGSEGPLQCSRFRILDLSAVHEECHPGRLCWMHLRRCGTPGFDVAHNPRQCGTPGSWHGVGMHRRTPCPCTGSASSAGRWAVGVGAAFLTPMRWVLSPVAPGVARVRARDPAPRSRAVPYAARWQGGRAVSSNFQAPLRPLALREAHIH